jgi:hypothetical protein
MFTPREIEALRRFWVRKPKRQPPCTVADWSRVTAARPKIIGVWGQPPALRVPAKGKNFSWRVKRSYFLARQQLEQRPIPWSKLRQGRMRAVNRPTRERS